MSLRTIQGRNRGGRTLEVFGAGGLGVLVDKWHVNIRFAREDHSRLPGDWKTVEMLEKNGRLPTKAVWANLHIMPAVRMLGHMRASYAEERMELEAQCKVLHRINLDIGKGTGQTIWNALVSLAKFDDSALKSKHSAVKAIIAEARLEEACKLLDDARELPADKRALKTNDARAVLVSLENRLGKWRLEKVDRLFTRTLRREWLLRLERDNWMLSRLGYFAANPKRMREYEQVDQVKLDVLARIKAMMDTAAPKQEIFAYMRAMSQWFRVPQRNGLHAEDYVYSFEHGIKPGDAWKVDYLIGHYRWLWSFIKQGMREKALKKLEQLEVFVRANKPGFMLDELKKDVDPYLRGIMKPFGLAVSAYDNFDIAEASHQFAAALEAMKKVIAQSKRAY
jgi:hypothetical protein